MGTGSAEGCADVDGARSQPLFGGLVARQGEVQRRPRYACFCQDARSRKHAHHILSLPLFAALLLRVVAYHARPGKIGENSSECALSPSLCCRCTDVAKGSFYANPQYNYPSEDPAAHKAHPEYCLPNIWYALSPLYVFVSVTWDGRLFSLSVYLALIPCSHDAHLWVGTFALSSGSRWVVSHRPRKHLPELEHAFRDLGQLMVSVGGMVAQQCDLYGARDERG